MTDALSFNGKAKIKPELRSEHGVCKINLRVNTESNAPMLWLQQLLEI